LKVALAAALIVALVRLTGCSSWLVESIENSVDVATQSRQCILQNHVDIENQDQMAANTANSQAAERASGIADITELFASEGPEDNDSRADQ
jgi:outer membrane murein-binding lipoprotein Lpp